MLTSIAVSVTYEEGLENLHRLVQWHAEHITRRNEATTRLHLINRLLTECLGWELGDITAEEPQGREYADYVLSAPRRVAIVEAKREGEYFEVPLPTFQALAQADPLNRRVVEQMLVGVATRQYARSLEPVPAGVVSRGTSKSSVSRRFVAKTAAQLRTWQSAPLDGLDLVALLLDGVHIGEHCLVVGRCCMVRPGRPVKGD